MRASRQIRVPPWVPNFANLRDQVDSPSDHRAVAIKAVRSDPRSHGRNDEPRAERRLDNWAAGLRSRTLPIEETAQVAEVTIEEAPRVLSR